ncbi:hypothetical protein ACGF3J_37330 [Streptomyces sp. NPDC048171]|uniref:hypothetical protein n=1 Tax=Streptomyces sp. NPDC048171 TaxID=3365504 RepID=UPI003721A80C
MKIRILVGGPDGAVLHDRPWPAVGDVVDGLPTTVAAHLVASEVAEEVTDRPPPARRGKSRKEDGDG